MILIIFFSGKFEVWTRRDDLIGLVQTTAALAAVGLAVLTLIQEIRNRNRYLKLLLAGVTVAFLLATLTGWLAVLTIKPGEHDLRSLSVRFLILGVIYLAVGTSGISLAPWDRRSKAVSFARLYDYSFFVLPLGSFLLWSRDLSLAAVTIVLSLGGMVYLVCGAVVLMILAWRVRPYEELLGERAFEIIRDFRDQHQAGTKTPELVTLDYLRSQLRSDNDTLRDAINALRREDRIIEVVPRFYYLPISRSETDQGRREVRNFEVVVAASSMSGTFSWGEIDAFISRKLRLPLEVVSGYFNPDLQDLLNEEFVRSDGSANGQKYYVHFKIAAIALFRQLLKSPELEAHWKNTWLSSEEEESLGNEILNQFSCFPAPDSLTNLPRIIAESVWKLRAQI